MKRRVGLRYLRVCFGCAAVLVGEAGRLGVAAILALVAAVVGVAFVCRGV